MPKPPRREHFYQATQADGLPDLKFSDLVRNSNAMFQNAGVVNTQPPPEREVVLLLSLNALEKVREWPMGKVYGFLFQDNLCLTGAGTSRLSVIWDFKVALKQLLMRVYKHNKSLEYYGGLNVVLYLPHGTISDHQGVYADLYEFCREVGKSVDMPIGTEIFTDESELRVFLKSELRRFVYGDTEMQCRAALA